ncbi:MAG: XRE family transcriptional regulator [Deltaproteobacteria bacterium]|nr:XRE family transcriptional regulator [Deltaproteobacteria bacterium]
MELIQQPTRRSRLDAWLRERRITKRRLAAHLGLSYARTLQILRGIYLTSEHRRRLVDAGLPPELLPEPSDD